MKEPSETKSDLILIILFAFFAGFFFSAFGILGEQYLWDPHPKEGAAGCFLGMLLLTFVFLFNAITLGKNLKRRVDRKGTKKNEKTTV